MTTTVFRAGNGAAWLDLLSTLEGRYRDTLLDYLDTPDRLAAWLDVAGLRPAAAVTEIDVTRVADLREALHRVTVAVLLGTTPRPVDVAVLDRTLAADVPLRAAAGPGRVRVDHPATVDEAMARLVRDAVQVLSGPRRASLRACGDNTCASIFLDDSGRRRWCTDERCGNRMRVRAHRARARVAHD